MVLCPQERTTMLHIYMAKPEESEKPGDNDKLKDIYQVHLTKSQLRMGTVRCHRCGKLGHVAWNCLASAPKAKKPKLPGNTL